MGTARFIAAAAAYRGSRSATAAHFWTINYLSRPYQANHLSDIPGSFESIPTKRKGKIFFN